MGPTAAGKSDLAMALCDQLPVEIISVDSAMIYRGMDIGSAKPTPEEQQKYPHRLIDIKDPAESYSVADFVHDAKREIADIQSTGKIPLLVGGTMMYFHALAHGLSDLPQASPKIRERLQQEADTQGWPALHARLQAIDPESFARIKPTDAQRIQRALEVYELTGKALTAQWAQREGGLEQPIKAFAIAPKDRVVLHERIAKRWHKMIEAGFIEEVRALYERGDLNIDMPSIRCVGYRQVWQYLSGELPRDELDDKAIAATRQLAKRQITWLRSWENLHWLDSGLGVNKISKQLSDNIH